MDRGISRPPIPNRDLTSLPLYDLIDDDPVDAFRRMFLTTTFGLPNNTLVPTGLPYLPKFDERFYALRTGFRIGSRRPSTEIAGDLMALRLGADQRWQTKRGPPTTRTSSTGSRSIPTLRSSPTPTAMISARPSGLANYNFVWHVGDRLTMLSSGLFDFFDQGQKLVSVGGFPRSPAARQPLCGPGFSSGSHRPQHPHRFLQLLMSPKWISTLGTTYDFGSSGNIGKNFSIARIGETFLISAGFNVDVSRGSVGTHLAVEPRLCRRIAWAVYRRGNPARRRERT